MTSPLPDPARPALGVLSLPVVVAALGYFVDIYDIVLVGMVRNPSLADLGIDVADTALAARIGGTLLGLQMVGMLLGGFLWGVVADRRGRMTTLFASIITYSLATALNGLVTELWQYQALRVVAGIGLAGELGIGVTLVCESLPPARRALGTTVVASVGIAGAVAGWLCSNPAWFHWRTAYLIGGGMGLALLGLRWLAHESALFERLDRDAPRGSLRLLFGSWPRLRRYAAAVAIGAPIWYVVGIYAFGADRMAQATGVEGRVGPRDAILWCYVGLIAGDLAAGLLSQALASRRRALLLFLAGSAAACSAVLLGRGWPAWGYLAACGVLGFSAGFWVLFATVAAESFGTNLRATVATTVPNIARGLLYPVQWLILGLGPACGHLTMTALVGAACFAAAVLAVRALPETHGRDLDWRED